MVLQLQSTKKDRQLMNSLQPKEEEKKNLKNNMKEKTHQTAQTL